MGDPEVLMRQLILGVSAAATGLMLWTGVQHGHEFFRHRRWWDFWFSILLFGVVGVLLLVGQLVYDAEGIPLTWQAFAYGACVSMIALGIVGLMLSSRPERKEV